MKAAQSRTPSHHSACWLIWNFFTERTAKCICTDGKKSCAVVAQLRKPVNSPFLMASGSGDEEGNTEGVSWRLIGPAAGLSKKRCRLMYSSLGYDSDVCLFYVKGEFFAMDARCSHSGGPLCEGDIEEADGVLQVFCPWHDYNFDLRTGKSGTSLQQQVYEVKQEDGNVYVKHASRLSLEPFPADQKKSLSATASSSSPS